MLDVLDLVVPGLVMGVAGSALMDLHGCGSTPVVGSKIGRR
jgi:hypothetical protein